MGVDDEGREGCISAYIIPYPCRQSKDQLMQNLDFVVLESEVVRCGELLLRYRGQFSVEDIF